VIEVTLPRAAGSRLNVLAGSESAHSK